MSYLKEIGINRESDEIYYGTMKEARCILMEVLNITKYLG
jgi:hypothetical protein